MLRKIDKKWTTTLLMTDDPPYVLRGIILVDEETGEFRLLDSFGHNFYVGEAFDISMAKELFSEMEEMRLQGMFVTL